MVMPDGIVCGEMKKLFSCYTEQEDVRYLEEQLSGILHAGDPVLSCMIPGESEKLAGEIEQAAGLLGAKIYRGAPDFRWKNLLWQAFSNHIICAIGAPRVILGLAKLARATQTPLNIQNVVLVGYLPGCELQHAIEKQLDCSVRQCYAPAAEDLIVGFSREGSDRVVVRSDAFRVFTAGEENGPGEILLRRGNATLYTGDMGELTAAPGPDGGEELTISHLQRDSRDQSDPRHLDDPLIRWSSVLDYRVEQTPCGSQIELVVFPGEQLPRLPSCARMIVRKWNPAEDIPFPGYRNYRLEIQ